LWGFDPTLRASEVKDYVLRGADRSGRLVNNGGTPAYVLDVYESLKLIAEERPETPPCGMIAVRGDQFLKFWSIHRSGGTITSQERRTYPLTIGGQYDDGDLTDDYRSLYISALENQNSINTYRYDFLNNQQEVIYSTPTSTNGWSTFGVRSMADQRIIGSEYWFNPASPVTDQYRMLEYPNGEILVPDDFNLARPWWAYYNPQALSHNGELLAYISGTETFQQVFVTNLPVGESPVQQIIAPGGGNYGPWIYDGVTSPRGDAVATNNGRILGSSTYQEFIYLYKIDSSIYENPQQGVLSNPIVVPDAIDALVSRPFFTADGDGVIFLGFIDQGDDVPALCHLYYVDVETHAPTALSVIPCQEPMMSAPHRAVLKDINQRFQLGYNLP
jgi:hypothetical protein